MPEPEIKDFRTRKILDSRGNPTIEIEVELQSETGAIGKGIAAAPSGASRGVHEVVAFPDNSVEISMDELENIRTDLVGTTISDLSVLDQSLRDLDGTENLGKIGGNATVSFSMATAKALAEIDEIPLYESLNHENEFRLPYPLGNVLGGGEHAGRTAPDIQEFLVLPIGAENFQEAAFANAKVHQRVKELADERNRSFTGGKSDEGAWAPNISDEKALEVVAQACEEISERIGFEIRPGLDVAASSLYDSERNKYEYKRESVLRNKEEQIELILDYIESYDLIYVEDPIQEEDFESFAEITVESPDDCLICGDDLFVTNVERIERGVKINSANTVLIKPNQIGTLSATKEAIDLSKENDCVPLISHRSGETTDNTISHLAVGYGCPIIKTGVVGGERIAKLNELIRIEEKLGNKAKMGEI